MASHLEQVLVHCMVQDKSTDVVVAIKKPEIRMRNPSRLDLGTVSLLTQVLNKVAKVGRQLVVSTTSEQVSA